MYEGQERRKVLRKSFPCKITVGSPIRLFTIHTEDLSEGGVRVFLDEKLALFTTVGLEIFFEREKPLKCKGRISWVKEKVNPMIKQPILFDTGIQFLDISDSGKEYIKRLVKILSEGEGE